MANLSQRWQEFLEAANQTGFGIDHLPYATFSQHDKTNLCVRIGDHILDLEACVRHALFDALPRSTQQALAAPTLHPLLAEGHAAWQAVRSTLLALFAEPHSYLATMADYLFIPLAEVQIFPPITPPNYTDFYASIHHARRVGELFRPDNPLLPNYKHVPIAYNGRASSIIPSGTPITRPRGQHRPATPNGQPTFAPTAALDYELELAFILGGPANPLGQPIPIEHAHQHLFGIALLNDWSARDIQSWEYQPLGPFLGKSFATSISPWITPLAAIEPWRTNPIPRPTTDPQPLPYLTLPSDRTYDLELAVTLNGFELSHANLRDLYWTPAQMLAHLTSNGCNLVPGDLLGTGTISGPSLAEAGCLLELTRNGTHPITLPNGEQRPWLEDGDTVTFTARTPTRDGSFIELASCTGTILPASKAS